ncbi:MULTISPECIES: hypothetical protein [Myxococcaceae]|uniref:hypothetical protein n=1 Tax=Myxococcaceae TaxID=31 RepID=UPI00129C2F98|nr:MULTISPECIES: hypothetical protein [Myxococcaceae]MBF5043123.1 hypothetical protein [Simulacricoccus sp. 17bor-14]
MDATTAFVAIFITGMVVGIPLLGLTIRLSIKPLVDAWTRMRTVQPGGTSAELEALKLRVAALEAVFESPDLALSSSERQLLEGRPLSRRLTDKS